MAYLFALPLEIFFILIKSNKKIHGINIFNHEVLYTAYVDDTAFFLKDLDSIENFLEINFTIVPWFSPNLSKCEKGGIDSLKDAKLAVCGMKSLDLTKESLEM